MSTAQTPKVLFVDDEVRLIESMAVALRRSYNVLAADSGARALQMLQDHPDIAVMVSDMRMPGMDGATLLKQVAQHHPQVGRILLTGQSTMESAVRAVNEGRILRFLCKPCPMEQLRAAIEEGLAHCRQYRQSCQQQERLALLERQINERNRAQQRGARAPGENTSLHQTETELLQALHTALHNNQLTMHYQPLVDIASRRIVSLEALVRWPHPQWGMIPPDRFIPLAERSGLIVPLGRWILQHVCAQLMSWSRQQVPLVPVAVNVSAIQLQHDLESQVQDVLTATGLAPALLSLEVTESMLMDNATRNATTLQQLRDAGIHISIDDFGTGYSSLSQLKQLPVDTLKIDRSFIMQVASNSTDESIVKAILTLARELRLQVVAEGVETAEQLAVLHQHGCTVAQGFHFSRPLPAEQCRHLLSEASLRPNFTETLRLNLADIVRGRMSAKHAVN